MNTRQITIPALLAPFIFAAALLFAGCELSTYEPDPIDAKPTDPPQQTSMFTADESTGEWHFYTNEVRYLSTMGCTFWITGDEVSGTMETFEFDSRKVSGDRSAGYGAIFAVKDINNFYTVLVNVNGNYLIGKYVDENFTTLQEWTPSTAIISGYGAANKIAITNNTTSGHYEIRFNGTYVTEFEDNTAPVFEKCGRYGYIACVSPYETFPSIGVDVYFKQVTPVDISL